MATLDPTALMAPWMVPFDSLDPILEYYTTGKAQGDLCVKFLVDLKQIKNNHEKLFVKYKTANQLVDSIILNNNTEQ